MWTRAEGHRCPQKLEEEGEDPLLEPSEGMWPGWHLECEPVCEYISVLSHPACCSTR